LTREELVKSSWKKSNYTKRIINFYLGNLGEITESAPVAKLPKPVRKAQVN
jgi:hypothetical protein